MPLSDKHKLLMKYFKNGIESVNRNIAHSVLFYGNDIKEQYNIALEVARILNCTGDKSEGCNCLNCRWIREGKHPAVLTITKSDNKDTGDSTKTVISASQVNNIKSMLMTSSDYYRVIVFADRDKDGNISPLNKKVFPETAANALLKTFEEAPHNTLFFFLTKNKSDVISTIASRCQCFFVASDGRENRDFSSIKSVVQDYFNIDRNEVMNFNDSLYNLVQDGDITNVLGEFKNYILSVIENNLDNSSLKDRLISDLKLVETAVRQADLGINSQTIIETLCFNLILK